MGLNVYTMIHNHEVSGSIPDLATRNSNGFRKILKPFFYLLPNKLPNNFCLISFPEIFSRQ